jgi:hypothetical protein
MNFTILGPSDGQLKDNKSDMTDTRFGGQRKNLSKSVADAKDYTKRTGTAPNKKENPVDETTRDIDDLANEKEKKSEFSYQEDKMDVQKGNDSVAIQSDSDRRPPEDTDAFTPDPSDPNFLVKTRRSKLKNQFGDGQYDNPQGAYEGEIS